MLETVAFVVFVIAAIWFIRKLYNEATEAQRELKEGIQDVRAKGKEICEETEKFFRDPDNREKLKRAAIGILAEGIGKGIEAAHRQIQLSKTPESNVLSRNTQETSN